MVDEAEFDKVSFSKLNYYFMQLVTPSCAIFNLLNNLTVYLLKIGIIMAVIIKRK